MERPEYHAVRLLGRCANGNEADGGSKFHALRKDGLNWKAVCGAAPGRRSAGWADHPTTVRPVSDVTCPRCRTAMQKFGFIAIAQQSDVKGEQT